MKWLLLKILGFSCWTAAIASFLTVFSLSAHTPPPELAHLIPMAQFAVALAILGLQIWLSVNDIPIVERRTESLNSLTREESQCSQLRFLRTHRCTYYSFE